MYMLYYIYMHVYTCCTMYIGRWLSWYKHAHLVLWIQIPTRECFCFGCISIPFGCVLWDYGIPYQCMFLLPMCIDSLVIGLFQTVGCLLWDYGIALYCHVQCMFTKNSINLCVSFRVLVRAIVSTATNTGVRLRDIETMTHSQSKDRSSKKHAPQNHNIVYTLTTTLSTPPSDKLTDVSVIETEVRLCLRYFSISKDLMPVNNEIWCCKTEFPPSDKLIDIDYVVIWSKVRLCLRYFCIGKGLRHAAKLIVGSGVVKLRNYGIHSTTCYVHVMYMQFHLFLHTICIYTVVVHTLGLCSYTQPQT